MASVALELDPGSDSPDKHVINFDGIRIPSDSLARHIAWGKWEGKDWDKNGKKERK